MNLGAKNFGLIHIKGELCNLRPLKINDTVPLYEVSRDNRIWKYLSMHPQTLEEMESFIKNAIQARKKKKAIPFVIVSKIDKQICGVSRILDIIELHRTAEIGLTWLSPQFWGKGINTDAHYLMLKFCFESIGLRRVQFKVDEKNIHSLKSLEKMGATKEGLLRNLRSYPNGTYNNTYIYSIIDKDWEAIRFALMSKLAYE